MTTGTYLSMFARMGPFMASVVNTNMEFSWANAVANSITRAVLVKKAVLQPWHHARSHVCMQAGMHDIFCLHDHDWLIC